MTVRRVITSDCSDELCQVLQAKRLVSHLAWQLRVGVNIGVGR
jgi:hypothetical protein